MLKFNVGTNFDIRVLEKAIELNKEYKKDKLQIAEFYGSLHSATARPAHRLPNVSYKDLEKYIILCNENNIKFNYTLNSPLTDYWFNKSESQYTDLISMLRALQVNIVTVAHMIPLKYLFKHFNIEISTIMEVQSLEAILYYIKEFSVKKICLSITKNRDFQFLKKLSHANIHKNVELLVNEFCSIEGIPCQNLYRKSCYELHALGGNKNKIKHGYPLKLCSASRYADSLSWVKANVIFPWDIKRYHATTGIENFKISARTLPTKYIIYIMEAYMSQGKIMKDNILSLWGHVDRAERDDINKVKIPNIHISAKKLQKIDFIDFFIRNNIDCQKRYCSICSYCKCAL